MIQWKALILCPCWHRVNHKCNLGLYGSYHSLWQRRKVFSSRQAAWLHHMVVCICVWCDVSELKLMKPMMVIIFRIIMAQKWLLFVSCFCQSVCPHSPRKHIFILSRARLIDSPGEEFLNIWRKLTTGNMWLDAWRHFTLLSQGLLVILKCFFQPAWAPKFRNVLLSCNYKWITAVLLFSRKWWKTYAK